MSRQTEERGVTVMRSVRLDCILVRRGTAMVRIWEVGGGGGEQGEGSSLEEEGPGQPGRSKASDSWW